MKKSITVSLLSISLCIGCNDNKNAEKTTDTTKKEESTPTTTDAKPQTLSGIEYTETGGLKISRAFVSTEEGNVFSKEVTAGTDEKLILNLNLDGFKTADDKAFLGVAEKITASDGTVLLDEQDLFANYTNTGMSSNDAHFIRLTAVITGNAASNPYYTVSFRVWDKKGDGEVAGSYKITSK